MKELFENLPEAEQVDFLLDTCFLVHVFSKDHIHRIGEFCRQHKVGISSFNIEEFLHMHHKMPGQENHHIRSFLKGKLLFRVPVPVHPGNREEERSYVMGFDPEILKDIRDPSDAVLFALAVKVHADILTRDRHHVFTALAENYAQEHRIKVYNEFPD